MAALEQERAAKPVTLEDTPMEEMTKDEMKKDGYYNSHPILDSK